MPISTEDRIRLRALLVSIRKDAQDLVDLQRGAIAERCGEHRAVGDNTDDQQSEEATGTAIAICGTAMQKLREVDDALRSLTTGSYGKCTRCSEEMPVKRLEAVPFALLCIACAEEDERETERRKHTPVYGPTKKQPEAPAF